eukprot:CAMPEP_0118677068 /NCGR_PEP_ID=MMETSP0800-20121206/2411_1 /TAXON_ID=210618 ORGANISM="Striatella unipunctata, Strain CCMP2910" /NCGR_SAMPLE_ID=MMETSP0800 /ASSEMBLY_ACC=CAM_ASM_000638 /LENGTH=156 /DNA_ID=CAMNT_0006572679 /DNA_START=16 /DNA_END=486 /DNA_ORIENTATION=+
MTGTAEAKLKELGIEIPIPPEPKGNYIPVVGIGNVLHLCGHVPQSADGKLTKGKLGVNMTVEEGYQSARLCAINIIATLKRELGELDRIKRIVKVVGFVNCSDEFGDQPKVINGASDLFAEVFGEAGRHARSAVGSNALPLGIATEVECVVEIIDS